jgi:hypothetical protein
MVLVPITNKIGYNVYYEPKQYLRQCQILLFRE